MQEQERSNGPAVGRLKRGLGSIESYAALLGMLVGAGIFAVTADAYQATGPSVLLGYVVVGVLVLATSVSYAAFASTSVGESPGGELATFERITKSRELAFLGAWLKLICYVGVSTYLATRLVDQLAWLAKALELAPMDYEPKDGRKLYAVGLLAVFWGVHVIGVRSYGRVQVALCAILGVSIAVLVGFGAFHVELANFQPFFEHGSAGFLASLPLVFFAFAGFEAIAHSGGEVERSRERLPRVFVVGILWSTLVFLAMSVVAFGVLPGERLARSSAPMADVAAVFLPRGGTVLVALGAVLAIATTVNACMYVPARLAMHLAHRGQLPRFVGHVHPRTGTPAVGLTLHFALSALLLLAEQVHLALKISLLTLSLVYGLHALALLLLPRLDRALEAEVTKRLPRALRTVAALVAIGGMATIVGSLVADDLAIVFQWEWFVPTVDGERRFRDLTSLELVVLWTIVGGVLTVGQTLLRPRPSRDTLPSESP